MTYPLTTTLNRIWACNPCDEGKRRALRAAGKHAPDDEPITYQQIVEAVGLDDALWCCRAEPQYDREWRLFAVWRARQVQHLMSDQRSIDALDVAERYAHGEATDEQLDAARAAARDAAWDAWDAAEPAPWAATWAATRATARAPWATARDATRPAWAAARDAQRNAFIQLVTTGELSKTDWRALCEELADALACHYPGHVDDDELVKRARAALAQPEPEVRELSDQELDDLADATPWHGSPRRFGREVARAAIAADRARWGRPAPAPAGEVAELVAALELEADAQDPATELQWTTHDQLRRAADLLKQCQAALVPVASDTRYEFSVVDEDCTEQAGGSAPTYAQALSEGQHYLAQYQQDGPHTLELRRVEVLPPGAFPAPDDAPLPVLPEDAQVIEPTERTILVPACTPAPVSERPWEREGWCDEQGQCWMGDPGGGGFIPSWRLCRPEDAPNMKVSLPFNALPLPSSSSTH